MARLIDLNVTTYWWVPAASITDPAAISAAVLTSAANISQYVVSTTSAGPTASDTVSERGITDTSNVQVPTIGNYEGNLVMFRDYTAGVPSATDPLTTIAGAAGVTGWLVKRVGVASTSAAAAGQKIAFAGKFTTDAPQVSGGQGDGYVKVTIPLLQAGSYATEATLVA